MDTTQLQEIYILNPYYSLRNDRKRIVLSPSPAFKVPTNIAEENISLFMHPVFAIVFSFFDGEKTLQESLEGIASVLKNPIEDCYYFVSPFLENSSRIGVEYDHIFYEFPINILLKNTCKKYSRRQFDYKNYWITEDLDIQTNRMFEAPSNISLLINTVCATDCIYCYVDRGVKNNCKIPIERLKELIWEAKNLGVVDFDIAGTEIFMYKHWKELIKELVDNGYYPYLSTKLPIREESIITLKNIGIKHLQLSIDTLNPYEAKIVNRNKTDNYIDKMFYTLELLEKHGFIVAVNTVITKYNSTFAGIRELMDRLNQYNNIETFTINPSERSLGCSGKIFDSFKNTTQELQKLEYYTKAICDDYHFRFSFAGYTIGAEFNTDIENKKKIYENRATCTANISQMCILSDGQVTICEELYWNKDFLIGNVLEQSIKEIWTSERALQLSKQHSCNFSEDSACKSCPFFEKCRNEIGVCWSDVLAAYGEDHRDYPSPYCPYAPTPIYSMHHG